DRLPLLLRGGDSAAPDTGQLHRGYQLTGYRPVISQYVDGGSPIDSHSNCACCVCVVRLCLDEVSGPANPVYYRGGLDRRAAANVAESAAAHLLQRGDGGDVSRHPAGANRLWDVAVYVSAAILHW